MQVPLFLHGLSLKHSAKIKESHIYTKNKECLVITRINGHEKGSLTSLNLAVNPAKINMLAFRLNG